MSEAPRTKRYYGWTIITTLAITETISWGIIYYAFSVFLKPMEAETGWSRAELTGAYSVGLLVMGVMAFPVGSWVDKHGARALMTIGSILASLLMVVWSRVTDLTTFYILWVALGVCASLVLYDTAFAVVAKWFVAKRTSALAIITFAAGLASTIFVPLSDFLLNLVGWRDAVLILGIILAVTTILPHALILRRSPDDLGYLPDGGLKLATMEAPIQRGNTLSEALRNRFFWVLILTFSLSYLSASAIRVHFIPILTDSGIDASVAAIASGSIGIMQVIGRLFFAPIEMRTSSYVMVGGVFAMQFLSLTILGMSGLSVWLIIPFILFFGMSFGANTLARPSIIADTFGSAHYGRIASVMVFFLTLAGTIAPVGAGLLYDRFGNYDLVLVITVVLALSALTIILLSKPKSPHPEIAS
jgi:predicted MFS family arabinose efflux permease